MDGAADVIVPDWFWHAWGSKIIRPFEHKRVNPVSIDLCVSSFVRLQRYRGREFNDLGASVKNTDGRCGIVYRDPVSGCLHASTEPFQPGDSVLASTKEYLVVPRWLRLQGMLKSSTARAGMNHRTALYVDPGFRGHLTLELVFDRSGYLIPDRPVIQVEGVLAFPRRPYTGRYQNGKPAEVNRNRDDLGFVPIEH